MRPPSGQRVVGESYEGAYFVELHNNVLLLFGLGRMAATDRWLHYTSISFYLWSRKTSLLLSDGCNTGKPARWTVTQHHCNHYVNSHDNVLGSCEHCIECVPRTISGCSSHCQYRQTYSCQQCSWGYPWCLQILNRWHTSSLVLNEVKNEDGESSASCHVCLPFHWVLSCSKCEEAILHQLLPGLPHHSARRGVHPGAHQGTARWLLLPHIHLQPTGTVRDVLDTQWVDSRGGGSSPVLLWAGGGVLRIEGASTSTSTSASTCEL